MFKYLFIILTLIFPLNLCLKAESDFEKALENIQVRKNTMQNIWLRVKRLSPYVELNETVDYEKKLAEQDAKEINLLLSKARAFWPENTNLSGRSYTNATPAIWALQDYFYKLYDDAELASKELSTFIEKDNIEGTAIAMCNLGKACGTCHANFRRLLTSQLANEVSGWSGKYIKDCN